MTNWWTARPTLHEHGFSEQIAKQRAVRRDELYVGRTALHPFQQRAEVFGTASPRNHAALIAAGATPFPYWDKGWIGAMRDGGGVDAVFDALGFESFDESYS